MTRRILVWVAVLLLGAHATAQCPPHWLAGDVSTGFNNEVHAFAEWNGGLVALGRFTQVGSAPAAGVAYWNNEYWAPLGAGFSGNPLAGVEFDRMLVVGGASPATLWRGLSLTACSWSGARCRR
jgi:hypothetical protein